MLLQSSPGDPASLSVVGFSVWGWLRSTNWAFTTAAVLSLCIIHPWLLLVVYIKKYTCYFPWLSSRNAMFFEHLHGSFRAISHSLWLWPPLASDASASSPLGHDYDPYHSYWALSSLGLSEREKCYNSISYLSPGLQTAVTTGVFNDSSVPQESFQWFF